MKRKTLKKKKHSRANEPEKDRPIPPGIRRPAEFEEYALFMALDSRSREELFGFKTDKQFAAARDVNAGTLSEWKWLPELWEARDRYLLHFKKYTPEILAKLAERARRTGEAFHVQTYMKLVEGWTDKTGLDITSKGKKIGGFKVIVHNAPNASPQPQSTGAGK